MENQQIQGLTHELALSHVSDLAAYHREMEENYAGVNPDDVKLSNDLMGLIAYNGYYALDSAPGAFFAVDTNIQIQNGSTQPIYDISVIISTTGTKAVRYKLVDATFYDNVLVMKTEFIWLEISFKHTDGSDGTTVQCYGNFTIPGSRPVTLSGSGYNNPVPYFICIGEYYETVQLHLNPDKEAQTAIKVLSIRDKYKVWYDYGSNDGNLKPVPTYTYNLNMYYFSFKQGSLITSFIMGTAEAGGLACNNMTVDSGSGSMNSRSLQTIPFPTNKPIGKPNPNSGQLAAYSGYYQLLGIAPGAFISLQGEYSTLGGYVVKIGISLDGVKSDRYQFDANTMSFVNNTLVMSAAGVNLVFSRQYDSGTGTLVKITGSVMGYSNLNAATYFNPIPLMGFGGATMKDLFGNSLTLVNNGNVIYNKKTITSFLYVPIMYILWSPENMLLMSFGTNGTKGNTCIVTDYSSGTPKIAVVSAIR